MKIAPVPNKLVLIRPVDFTVFKEFNLGLGYVAKNLINNNFQVETLSCDLFYHEDIELIKYFSNSNSKVFGISALYPSFKEVIGLCELIRSAVPDSIIILGGGLVSPTPEFVLEKTGADIAVINEGEDTIVEIMNSLCSGNSVDNVSGIAFKYGKEIFRTENRKKFEIKNGEKNWPAWDLFPIDNYINSAKYYPFKQNDKVMNIITSRGCPYECNFCFNNSHFGYRDLEDVLQEIEYLIDRYKVNGFYIEDDLFIIDKKRVIKFCNELLYRNIKIQYTITGRFNIVDEDTIIALKETGCNTIFYGAESADQEMLDSMKKRIKVEQIYEGIRLTRKHGIFSRMGIMFGEINETEETLRKSVQLLKDITYGDFETRYIYGCIPFPGTLLYQHCLNNGLLSSHDDLFNKFDFGNNRILDQIPVNMTLIRNKSVESLLREANSELKEFYKSKMYEWV